MSSKNKNKNGIVFSTSTDFDYTYDNESVEETLAPKHQMLKVFLDRKPGGKLVSRINGFIGNDNDLNVLGSQLKKHCGGGGTVKDGEIFIQGDHRDKILKWLEANHYKCKKAGG